jgi:hypothetical protein
VMLHVITHEVQSNTIHGMYHCVAQTYCNVINHGSG